MGGGEVGEQWRERKVDRARILVLERTLEEVVWFNVAVDDMRRVVEPGQCADECRGQGFPRGHSGDGVEHGSGGHVLFGRRGLVLDIGGEREGHGIQDDGVISWNVSVEGDDVVAGAREQADTAQGQGLGVQHDMGIPSRGRLDGDLVISGCGGTGRGEQTGFRGRARRRHVDDAPHSATIFIRFAMGIMLDFQAVVELPGCGKVLMEGGVVDALVVDRC